MGAHFPQKSMIGQAREMVEMVVPRRFLVGTHFGNHDFVGQEPETAPSAVWAP